MKVHYESCNAGWMTLTIDMIQLNLTYCLDLETINNKRQVGTERSTLSAD
jgi:hypothetical protein